MGNSKHCNMCKWSQSREAERKKGEKEVVKDVRRQEAFELLLGSEFLGSNRSLLIWNTKCF